MRNESLPMASLCAAAFVAVLLAPCAWAVKTNDVELGYQSVYDDQVHIRRTETGDITFQDVNVTSPVTLSDLTENGESVHGELSGLSSDDHPQYLTSARHLSTHGSEFNAQMTIPADPKGNVRIGDHVTDSDIHLDRTQTIEIPGDWRFSGTPVVWNDLDFSDSGAAGDAALNFESATPGAHILWDESEARFSFNRELAVENGPSLPPRLRVGNGLTDWVSTGSVLRIDPIPGDAGNLRLGVDAGDKVGIGTDAPATALHVKSASDHADAQIEAGADKRASLGLKNDAREWVLRCDGTDGDKMKIVDVTAAADRLTIDSSGRIGIATTTPSDWLNVVETASGGVTVNCYSSVSANTPEIRACRARGSVSSPSYVDENDGLLRIAAWGRCGDDGLDHMGACIDFTSVGEADDLVQARIGFQTCDGSFEPAERMCITSEGRVGIGTGNPDTYLEIEGPGTTLNTLMTLDQNDQDYGFIDFQGTSGAGKSISTTEKSVFYRMIMIEINGVQCWLKAYAP